MELNMKEIMKENKANNLRLGAIYINTNTGQPARLITILPCKGVWMETYDGQGYGETVKFEDVSYADMDEVKDFLQDLEVFNGSDKAPSHKPVTYDEGLGDEEIARYENKHDITPQGN